MKIDKKYIKMCEKAEEIQKKWKPQEWDYCYCYGEFGGVVVLSEYETDGGVYGHGIEDGKIICTDIDYMEREIKHIWLPRQDQLQEMLNIKWHELGIILYLLIGFWKVNEKKFSSIEQLLLAFVMKKKYNKEWNDEKEEWKS